GELTAEVRKRMGNGGAVIEPVGAFAYKAEGHGRRGEVVPDRDAVQVVRRSVGFNCRARCRGGHGWDRHRGREGEAAGGYWRAGRILFVDFLDRYQKVQAAVLERARRAVGEPYEVPLRVQVAGHIARKHDVVEDEQPARGVVAVPADVGGQRVRGRKVPDRAVAVDIDLRRRNRVDKAIHHAAAIGNAID